MINLRFLGIAALATAALASPTSMAHAQTDAGVRSSSVPSYHLVQLSISADEGAIEAFRTDTQSIRSCDDAMDVARTHSADITRNRFVRATRLPSELQDILRDLPTGHATPLFGVDGAVRALVICNRL